MAKRLGEGEDLVQDTIVKILENKDRYDSSKSSMETWAFHIMQNVLINQKTRGDPSVISLDTLTEEDELKYLSVDPYEEKADNSIVIKDAIDTLPKSLQDTARLIFIEGFTYKETAAKLGISPSTVNQKVVSIYKRLRKDNGTTKGSNKKGRPKKEKSTSSGATLEQEIPREESGSSQENEAKKDNNQGSL